MHASTKLGPLGLPVSFAVRDIEVSPALVLAPMEGVTDLAFRRLIRGIGGTGMTWTEFIPGNGLSRGDDRAIRMADLDPEERPVVVQIFGREPADLADAARLVQDLGASAVDINMGCPSKQVCRNSGGSALMREPKLVAEIVAAVRAAVDIPLMVKMRSGFDANQRNAPELAWIAQEQGAEAVTIHWRTRTDRYGGLRAVDCIAQAVARVTIPVIGNGDIVDASSAEAMLRDTGCDGLMIGRGAMANPWIFRQLSAWLCGQPPPEVGPLARLDALLSYVDHCQRHYATNPQRARRPSAERATLGRFKQLARYFMADLGDGGSARTAVLRSTDLDGAIEQARAHFMLAAGEPDAQQEPPQRSALSIQK